MHPDELVERVYLPARRGSLQVEMQATARGLGLLAVPLAPHLTALLTELAAGNPVLVLQNLAFGWAPRWHYAVVIGYDLDRQTLLLRSGTERRWQTSMANFERTWRRADHWALVVVPPARVPVSSEALVYAAAVRDLEKSDADAAGEAWQAASERWPNDPLIWMGLGNHAFHAKRFEVAEHAFRRAVGVDADNAAAWNNLAYALHGRGCATAARAAVDCAVGLEPANQNLSDSARELRDATGTRACEPLPECPVPR